MPRSVRFPRHCGWNLIDADPIKQFPLIDSSCTANYVNGRCWQKWILSRFEDLLEEFRGEIRISILIRDTIVLSSFLEREAEMALVHQKLICSIPE